MFRKNERVTKKQIALTAIFSALAALIVVFSSTVVYAYFSTQIRVYTDDQNNTTAFRIGMELNSFFDELNSGTATGTIAEGTVLNIVCTDTTNKVEVDAANHIYRKADDKHKAADGSEQPAAQQVRFKQTAGVDTTDTSDDEYYYVYNGAAPWGSPSNPYIISKINHLQNLYVLQNCGYFNTYYVVKDASGNMVVENGEYVKRKTELDMPYFLVCTSVGAPVTINGTDKTFEYIGNDENPFIGYVGGAFVTGTTTVSGKSSDQSVIYNLTVKTDKDVTDVGVFGSIGYLGKEGTAETFQGSVSSVRNLLLCDVRVKVEQKSAWEVVSSTVGHLFSFTKMSSEALVPHENHHIGILAGHIQFATIEDISVYYSSNDIAALDVNLTNLSKSGKSANYMSVSGILGYVYHMNTKQLDGWVTVGGVSNDEIALSAGGESSGGGLTSGTGRGYVTAAEILSQYGGSGNILRAAIITTVNNPDGTTRTVTSYKYGIEVVYTSTALSYPSTSGFGTGGTTHYMLADGTPVVLSDNKQYVSTYSEYANFLGVTRVNAENWYNFIIHENGKYYYYPSGSTTRVELKNEVISAGISLRYAARLNEGEFERLCTQYLRDRIISGTQATDRYYFYDGVFTFALSQADDSVSETWKTQNSADTFTLGSNNASDWQVCTDNTNRSQVSYVKQLTTMAELNTALDNNKMLYFGYSVGNGKYFLASLSNNTLYDSTVGDDSLVINGKQVNIAPSSVKDELYTNINQYGTDYQPNKTNLINQWSSISVLNLGNTKDDAETYSLLSTKFEVRGASQSVDPSQAYVDQYGNPFPPSGVTVNETAGTYSYDEQYVYDGFFCWYWDYSGVRADYTFCYCTIVNGQRNLYAYAEDNGHSIVGSSAPSGNDNYAKKHYVASKGYSSVTYTDSNGTTYTVYSRKINGVTYVGRLFYEDDDRYGSQESAIKQVSVSQMNYSDMIFAKKTTTGTFFQEIKNSDGTTTYKYGGSVLSASQIPTITSNTTTIAMIHTVHNAATATDTVTGTTYDVWRTADGKTGFKVTKNQTDRYYLFSDRTSTYYMAMLRLQSGLFNYNNVYRIVCGDIAFLSEESNFGNVNDVSAAATASIARNSDGTFVISYYHNQQTRFLGYATNVGGHEQCFSTYSSSGSNCNLVIFEVEGYQEMEYGYITYEPKDNTTDITMDADKYVLWPNEVYTGSQTTYKPNHSGYTTDPTYSLRTFELNIPTQYSAFGFSTENGTILTAGNGWKSRNGGKLTYNTLKNVFSLGKGIEDLNLLELWNGNTSLNNGVDNYVRAPIGTNGTEAYIPTGCVAFRVNEANADNKVRVIVAVPISEYYYGQTGSEGEYLSPNADDTQELDYANDYYFCMWKVQGASSGSTTTSIKLEDCIAAFELPRSAPYQPGTSPTDGDYYSTLTGNPTNQATGNNVKKYITISMNGQTYRCYLNGDQVLIAYEFSATEEGIYLLGSTKPCRVVYFSADATSSSSSDGTTICRIGSIDFVYDNGTTESAGNRIITIIDKQTGTGTQDTSQYYYSSLAMLYTDNSGTEVAPLAGDTDTHAVSVTAGGSTTTVNYANINDFVVKIRRSRTSGGGVVLNLQALGGKQWGTNYADAAYLILASYGSNGDDIVRQTDAKINRTS